MAHTAPVQQMARRSWVCLLVLGFALAAWSIKVDRPFAVVRMTGSLQRVNAGQVSPWDLKNVNLTGVIGGLGTGTLKKYNTTGDMLSFFGRTFIRATSPKTGPRVVEVKTPFSSPFALMITPQLNPAFPETKFAEVFPRTYRLVSPEPQLLHSVLEQLAVEANSPIAVIGWAEMPEVDGTALKKAPIGDNPLTGEMKAEYLEAIRASNANVVFFAVVSPLLPLPPVANTLLTTQAFDYDPEQGQPAAALIHVHGALVNEPVPIPDAVTTPLILEGLQTVTVNDILHVYGTSTVQRAAFLVYRLQYP